MPCTTTLNPTPTINSTILTVQVQVSSLLAPYFQKDESLLVPIKRERGRKLKVETRGEETVSFPPNLDQYQLWLLLNMFQL